MNVMENNLAAPTGDAGDYLRGRQVRASEENVEKGLVSFAVAATFSLAFFYNEYGAWVVTWYALVLSASAVRICFARCFINTPTGPLTIRQLRPFIAWSVCSSAIMLSFPSWVVMHADGLAFAFMLALSLGTFWSASFVHAPILASSIAFMLTQLVVITIAAAFTGPTWDNAVLMALYVIGVGSGYGLIKQHSETFRRSVLQQFKLEKQTEVIRLLLREHEDQSSDWLWQTDTEIRVVSPSPRFASAIGHSASNLAGSLLTDVLADAFTAKNTESLVSFRQKLEEKRPFRDHIVPTAVLGLPRWFCVSATPTLTADGTFAGFRGVMSDVTTSEQAEQRIRHLALHDGLTNLPNRSHFSAAMEADFQAARSFALLSIDLDGFKPINDCYGHPTGDAFLVEMSRRLQLAMGPTELIARFGGDEFIIKTYDCKSSDVEKLCEKLLKIIELRVEIDRFELSVGASIGVALAPKDGASQADLLKNADAALYRAKREGRGTFRFFEAEMDSQLYLKSRLASDLRQALARNELRLLYQPFIDARTGAVTGCEALVRWHHRENGVISPAEFIPLAEATGLIVPMGDWIINEACRTAARWPEGRRVAVNISPVQFRDHDLPERILAALHTAGLSPSRLEIEVTESLLVEDVAGAVDILRRIRAMGVRVALDDFGTGYSSLGYLRLFPFDKIKIDKSFVAEIAERQDCQIIVRAIKDIAHGLNMTITAEGVETERQAALLRETGCNEFQGYLFSRPITDLELQTWGRWQKAA